MQFAIDSNSSSLIELLYTVKGYIKKDMNSKKVETSFLVGFVEEISMSCILETCNVQCNRALILQYFNNVLLLLFLFLFLLLLLLLF
jgi:hypothetical protein